MKIIHDRQAWKLYMTGRHEHISLHVWLTMPKHCQIEHSVGSLTQWAYFKARGSFASKYYKYWLMTLSRLSRPQEAFKAVTNHNFAQSVFLQRTDHRASRLSRCWLVTLSRPREHVTMLLMLYRNVCKQKITTHLGVCWLVIMLRIWDSQFWQVWLDEKDTAPFQRLAIFKADDPFPHNIADSLSSFPDNRIIFCYSSFCTRENHLYCYKKAIEINDRQI